MMNDISTKAVLKRFSEPLRDARRQKGLSQRALAQASGLAQSQISKVENAEVDPQLTTLIELAQALDLELKLVPRSAVVAVGAVVRDLQTRAETRSLLNQLAEIETLLEAPVERIVETARDRLLAIVGDLRTDAETMDTRVARFVLDQARERLGVMRRHLGDMLDPRELAQLEASLLALRSVHRPASRPAYALDDED
ncbi:helix-turn-helix domain-containing protein [Brevundimonas huaxiensis]|uniref:helix-turn-helix domain-containing protein n=1 Tax=Brevundimonas huaxiensis TaxID=2725493 RepID=UPI0019660AE2|nr:helix-turn-helix domain-containing protein [Brevundimonas huaxiensis]